MNATIPYLYRSGRFVRACSMLLSLLMVGFVTPVGAQNADTTGTAFINVNVIPMDRERVLNDRTVIVRGDRIVAIGSVARTPVPAGVTHVDARGQFLLPGLADMHVHLMPKMDTTRYNVADALFTYLANGITTVRDMKSDAAHLALRRRIAAGELLGPRIYTAADPWDRQVLFHASYDANTPLAPNIAGTIPDSVAALKAAGYDFVKVYATPSPVFDSIVAASKRAGLPIAGHVPMVAGGLEQVLAAPWASIEHLTGYLPSLFHGDARWWDWLITPDGPNAGVDTTTWLQAGYRLDAVTLETLAETTRRVGVWNCPTLGLEEQISLSQGRLGQRWFDFHLQIAKALHDAGAQLILGTDVTPLSRRVDGFAIHRELELLVKAGLTPYEALATGTRKVSRFLGTLDSTGTIAVGKRADLVLLGQNPLTDIRHMGALVGVMAGGRWLPRVELEARMDRFQVQTYRAKVKQARAATWQ